MLRDIELVDAGDRVVAVVDRQFWRPGLRVPLAEARKVNVAALFHRRDKILDRRGVVVVAPDIKIHAAPETLRTQQGAHHADAFRFTRTGKVRHATGTIVNHGAA